MPRIRSKIQDIFQLKQSGTSKAPTYEILDPHSAEYYMAKFGAKNNSLVHAFKEMLYDEIMSFDKQMQQGPGNDYCGSTAVIAIVTGHHLIVANVGDSRAVLGNRSNEAIRITKDHKPDDVSVPNTMHFGANMNQQNILFFCILCVASWEGADRVGAKW